MRKLAVLILAISVLAVSAVVGCGGGDDETTPTVAAPATEAPMVDEPTVEAPMAETPMAAEPTAEAPMVDEPTVEAPMVETPMAKEIIIFSDLNWSSAQIQNRIAQYIVEEGYGYPTDVLFGATLPLLQGLRNGDTHVTMEIWLPNQEDAWIDALDAGEIIQVGHSLGEDWQSAFVIPAYLQEQYPELDSVEDLKEERFKALFATAETGGKARLVGCVIGWACEVVNAAQVEAYGLSDHVSVVNPGDSASANADFYGAYERQEPWLGYQWGTNDVALLRDVVRLEEPAFTQECWDSDMGCGYRNAEIVIAVRTDVAERAPEVIAMLSAWTFNIERFSSVVAWQQLNPSADVGDSALWWLTNNENVWGGWVTDDAAVAIRASLAANMTPDGWPTE